MPARVRLLPAGPAGSPDIRSPLRRRLASAAIRTALLTACLTLAAGPVLALGEPPYLQQPVTDQAGVLDATDEAAVADALAALRDDQAIQLFVAYIDTTEGVPVSDFAIATAEASSLGGNDALLLVAIEDRSDSMWVGPLLTSVTDEEIDRLLAETVEPLLADGQFADAMIAGADALGAAAASGIPAVTQTPVPATAAPVPGATSAPASGGSAGGSGGGIPILPILAVGAVVGGGALIVRSQLRKRNAGQAAAATEAELGREANRLLLATDEALKDAANDVEFASAQWGEPEVASYREAITKADAELRAAFAIRQQLDDTIPEPASERERLLREIIARAGGALGLLDAQEERFDQLGDLVAAAPAQLEALPARIDALRGRAATVGATAARVRTSFAATSTDAIAGNVEEAGKALDTAAAEVDRGRALVAAKPNDAVIALRTAQEAVAAATGLLDAVDRLAASLDDASRRVPGELEAAASDVETARQAIDRANRAGATSPGSTAAPGQPAMPSADALAEALRTAEIALGAARRAAEATPPDPLAALQQALAANQSADAVAASAQSAQQLRARRTQAAQAALAGAQDHITRASDFIATRRHGVGSTARTRIAEAELRLREAQSRFGADPEGASALAGRATQLADEAYRLASSDFGQWQGGGGPATGSPGNDIIGGILGGVIGGVAAGGARPPTPGSGWGGTPWGGPASGPSSGGFGGRPPGMGGGRIGGGGFGGGGGGGRARGGRW